MTPDKQAVIDQINEWVRQYKEEGNEGARLSLLEQFAPLLLKYSDKFHKYYGGVHIWEHVIHEAQVIFCDLLDEYTIGGRAYFNVFIEGKLPFRLRYYFVKEIKNRAKSVPQDDEQMAMNGVLRVEDGADDIVGNIDAQRDLARVMEVIDDDEVLSGRERTIIKANFLDNKTHEQIAAEFGVSRSRISRIAKKAMEKIKDEMGLRGWL